MSEEGPHSKLTTEELGKWMNIANQNALEREEFANKLRAITRWLEANQPDVFKRGLWDAIASPPIPDTLPRNSCNRHSDCRATDEAARAKGAQFGAAHCHDECCEDCFGC